MGNKTALCPATSLRLLSSVSSLHFFPHRGSLSSVVDSLTGIIELTHNYGTENDPDYKVANGNSEPGKGFGHFAISVDNLQAACQRIEDAGYKFQKKLTDGRMRSIAFVLDPNGYWIEVIGQQPIEKTEGVKTTDTQTYRMVCTSQRFP